MLALLGNVIYWTASGLALLVGLLAVAGVVLVVLFGSPEKQTLTVSAVFAVAAVVIWLLGRAAKYVLANR